MSANWNREVSAIRGCNAHDSIGSSLAPKYPVRINEVFVIGGVRYSRFHCMYLYTNVDYTYRVKDWCSDTIHIHMDYKLHVCHTHSCEIKSPTLTINNTVNVSAMNMNCLPAMHHKSSLLKTTKIVQKYQTSDGICWFHWTDFNQIYVASSWTTDQCLRLIWTHTLSFMLEKKHQEYWIATMMQELYLKTNFKVPHLWLLSNYIACTSKLGGWGTFQLKVD